MKQYLTLRPIIQQFHHALVPPAADPHGHWYHCKLNPAACNAIQIYTLQGFDLCNYSFCLYGMCSSILFSANIYP